MGYVTSKGRFATEEPVDGYGSRDFWRRDQRMCGPLTVQGVLAAFGGVARRLRRLGKQK